MEPLGDKTEALKPTMLTAYFIHWDTPHTPPHSYFDFHPDASLCPNNLEPSPNPHLTFHLHHIPHRHTCQHYHLHQNPIFHLHCTQMSELIQDRGDVVHSLLLHVSLTLIGFKTRAYHHTYFLISVLPTQLFPQALPIMNYLFLNCSLPGNPWKKLFKMETKPLHS